MMDITREIESRYEDMVAIRRHMHMNPEVSFQEENTKQYIFDQIKDFGFDIRRDVGGNGIVARLHVDDSFKTIGLRADFDALPIHDEKDVPYKSQVEGAMHACGHDAHTAMLITAARILSEHKDQLPVNVVFIHQHAEEVLPGGAKSMVEAGALDGVDYVFGQHVSSNYPVGTLSYTYDYAYASADSFTIKVQGQGGHGAEPHEAVDPVVATASLIQQLQSIVSRTTDPLKSAVVTVGTFNSGTVFNVIPDTAEIRGTVRTFEREVKEKVQHRIEGIARGIESSFDVQCTVEYADGYPALLNDNDHVDHVVDVMKDAEYVKITEENLPSMGGEDFAYFLQNKPGAYVYTGVRNSGIKADYPHHHPKFDIDETGMKAGVETLLKIVLGFKDK
ncbi:M20 metallopeptidase family protein [Salinicoccus halodurans]|uniref:Amidohydrolase n=2 Tax=Salinicoccus halodurans TaxID=407035 RepID=A0AA94KVA1_9STAP|nr:amidohydrolase [Salinicoccus halodurans]SFK65452.1 amidohydrolase [Salinicoccus halodurans]